MFMGMVFVLVYVLINMDLVPVLTTILLDTSAAGLVWRGGSDLAD